MPQFDPSKHFVFLTYRISRLMDLIATEIFTRKKLPFPTSCVDILADLYFKDGVLQKDIGYSIVRNKSSVTKMLDALESADVIERRDGIEDKRSKLIYLTDSGRNLCEQLKMECDAVAAKQFINITKSELNIVNRFLHKQYGTLYNFLKEASPESSDMDSQLGKIS